MGLKFEGSGSVSVPDRPTTVLAVEVVGRLPFTCLVREEDDL